MNQCLSTTSLKYTLTEESAVYHQNDFEDVYFYFEIKLHHIIRTSSHYINDASDSNVFGVDGQCFPDVELYLILCVT